MDTTDHKTVTKTNHLFSYWRHYFYPSCLQATHWLTTENLLLCLRAEAERPVPQCLPTSPGCISHLCPGGMYLLTTAFTPGDSSSHQYSQGCGCCTWPFQNHHSPSTEGNMWDSHLAPNSRSPLPPSASLCQPQLKAIPTCQANQLKLLRAVWLGMPSLP